MYLLRKYCDGATIMYTQSIFKFFAKTHMQDINHDIKSQNYGVKLETLKKTWQGDQNCDVMWELCYNRKLENICILSVGILTLFFSVLLWFVEI